MGRGHHKQQAGGRGIGSRSISDTNSYRGRLNKELHVSVPSIFDVLSLEGGELLVGLGFRAFGVFAIERSSEFGNARGEMLTARRAGHKT